MVNGITINIEGSRIALISLHFNICPNRREALLTATKFSVAVIGYVAIYNIIISKRFCFLLFLG